MSLKPWILFVSIALAAAQTVACSPEFHSCEERRNCSKGGGSSVSDAGAGGEGAVEEGTGAGKGGHGGDHNNGGATGGGDHNSGGASDGGDHNSGGAADGGDAGADCNTTPGSSTCGECPAGYTGTPSTGCLDINECTTNNGGCDKAVTCTNTPGSRVCGNCPFGYSGTGESGCLDINECTTNNGGCDKTVSCNNTPGGHTCGDCPTGYSGGGVSGCVDINECATNNGGCDAHVTCTNAPGSFTCGACPSGYSGTGSTGCVDINECATNNGGCSTNATCTNTAGSRTCACKSGYAGDGITCNAPGAGCKWNCTGSTCVQAALDNDGDGHGTSACAAAPGDDCDDTQSSVFPGATELCDGIDNDCDKKLDLSDGLSLVGTIQDMPDRRHVSIASPGDGTFKVLGTSPPDTTGLFSGTISGTGVGIFSGTVFSPSADTAYGNSRIAWASGIGQYGVVYGLNGFSGAGSRGGVMGANSCCWQDFNLPGGGSNTKGDVTGRGQGDLLFAATSDGNLNLSARDASGTTLTSNLAVSGTWDAYSPRVAASGTNAGVVWQTVSPRALNWSLISPTLAFGSKEQLSTSASYTDISAIDAGYGLAWIEGLGFRFAIKKPNGSTQCTASVVPFGTVPSNQQVAVADSSNGNVVVATSPDSNLIHLYRFDNACKLMDDIDVSTTSSAPTEPRVVRGGGHVVVYWTDSSGGHYRFLSDLLCH